MGPKMVDSPVAVVTGGSCGIGASVAKKLAALGHRIILTYNTHAFEAEEVVRSIREDEGDAIAVKVDSTNASEITLLAKHPWCKSGICALVLNHGTYERWPASQVDPDRMSKTLEINFLSSHRIWWELNPQIVDGASIIVIGSQLATKGSVHGADYAASKAALTTWARSLALDVADRDITVNVVAPGFVDTAILSQDSEERRRQREEEVPLGRIASPDEIAGVVGFLCSEDAAYMTAGVIHVNGGLYRP